MSSLSADTQQMLDSLQVTVTRTLERKKRLGHYAVIWRDGKPALFGDDAPVAADAMEVHQSGRTSR